ncbi:hypothetical protein Y032_0044g986 [Ancylostoma ceylanicum]|uniref:Uncharacterized protein n=1 Tax=Ancylostoma ceylanicum TaxID=53326 RepID=A0A016UDM7_9BILA|nr:hypothetical protein Y032_0044g986 [Ancylostoma ceylanicum]
MCVDDGDRARLDSPMEPTVALAQNDVGTAQENPYNVFHFVKESVYHFLSSERLLAVPLRTFNIVREAFVRMGRRTS